MTTVYAPRRCTQCKSLRNPSAFKSSGPRARCDTCRERARRAELTAKSGGVARTRARHLWSAYRVTPEQYDAMRAEQDHRCAICGRHEDELPVGRTGRPRLDGTPAAEGFRLVVDHCHDSNEVRGLLCVACNSAIGQMRDSPEILAAAIRYLVRANSHSQEPEREIDMVAPSLRPTRFPRVPPRTAPDAVHDLARQAWLDSFRAAAGIGLGVAIEVPFLGPAIDAAYAAGVTAGRQADD